MKKMFLTLGLLAASATQAARFDININGATQKTVAVAVDHLVDYAQEGLVLELAVLAENENSVSVKVSLNGNQGQEAELPYETEIEIAVDATGAKLSLVAHRE